VPGTERLYAAKALAEARAAQRRSAGQGGIVRAPRWPALRRKGASWEQDRRSSLGAGCRVAAQDAPCDLRRWRCTGVGLVPEASAALARRAGTWPARSAHTSGWGAAPAARGRPRRPGLQALESRRGMLLSRKGKQQAAPVLTSVDPPVHAAAPAADLGRTARA